MGIINRLFGRWKVIDKHETPYWLRKRIRNRRNATYQDNKYKFKVTWRREYGRLPVDEQAPALYGWRWICTVKRKTK